MTLTNAFRVAALTCAAVLPAQTAPSTLFGITTTGELYTIDTGTGVPTLVGSTGLAATECLSATFDGRQLVTAQRTATSIELYDLDPATGAATLRQTLPFFVSTLHGMAFTAPDRAVFAGTTWSGCGSSALCNLAVVDLQTATVLTTLRSSSNGGGLAYDHVNDLVHLLTSDSSGFWTHDAVTLASGGGIFGQPPMVSTALSHTLEFDRGVDTFVTGDQLYHFSLASYAATPIGAPFPPGLEFAGTTLLCHRPAVVNSRRGTPPNPLALFSAPAARPVFGQTWSASISHVTFMPNAILDGFFIAFGMTNAPTPWGTQLCTDIGSVGLLTAPGASYSLAVPTDCGILSLGLCVQGVSIDPSLTIQLTNALDLVIGTH